MEHAFGQMDSLFKHQKAAPVLRRRVCMKKMLVAGAGFEPATFRL